MYRYALILLIALLASLRLFADIETDQRIMHAIEEQLTAMLYRIRGGEEKQYGFRADDDIDECLPGRPYRVLTLNQAFYSGDLDTARQYLVTKNEWRIPVKMKGENRNMLTVTGTSGNYVIERMGDTTLAQELQMTGTGKEDSASYYLLYIPRLNAYFFVQETDNSYTDARFVPLATTIAAIPSLGSNNKPFYSLAETEIMIKQALSKPAAEMPEKTKDTPAKKKKKKTK